MINLVVDLETERREGEVKVEINLLIPHWVQALLHTVGLMKKLAVLQKITELRMENKRFFAKPKHKALGRLNDDLEYFDVGVAGSPPVHGHQPVSSTQPQSAVNMSANTQQFSALLRNIKRCINMSSLLYHSAKTIRETLETFDKLG